MTLRSAGWVLVLSLMLGAMLPVTSHAKPLMDFLESAQKPVSIDLRDSDVSDVLKFLAQKGKFNIYISPKVQGRVTLYLENVKIADILDIILVSNNLAFRSREGIVYIMSQDEYKARYGVDYADAREAKFVKLKYAAPSQVFKMLDPTKSSVGVIVVDEQTGTVILTDTADKIQFMLQVIQEMDQPLENKIFDLSYAKAEDVQTLLNAKYAGKGVEAAQADVRSNQLMVSAVPVRMKEIEEMVHKLDRKTREVAIDVKIIKINLSDRRQRGINFEYLFKNGVLAPLDLKATLPSSITAFGQISYNELASHGFNLLFSYLQTLGVSRILASPSITVVEGDEAKILIGTREAYVTSTTTTGSATSSVSESVSFIDVGISLNVSAQINKDKYVTMKIKPEISSVVRTLITPQNNQIPIVDTTLAETRVMIKSGNTLVIGGLRKHEKAGTDQQIPGVVNLPLIGKFFKNVDSTLTEVELVVLLTPHVLDGDQMSLPEDSALSLKAAKNYDNEMLSSSKDVVISTSPIAAPELKPAQTYPDQTRKIPQ